MKVGVLVGNPGDKSRHGRVGFDRTEIRAYARKFAIRKDGVKSAMADRMNRLRGAPTSALGYGMMQFSATTDRPGAKPAKASRGFDHSPIAGVEDALPARHR